MEEYKFDPLVFEEKDPADMQQAAKAFYQSIRSRRTVRDFSDRSIPQGVIEDCLLAAGTAPSGANMQPWHFAVVSDAAVKREIRLAAEQEEREFYQRRASEEWLDALRPLGTDEHKPFLEEAPCLIVVFLKKFSEDEHGQHLKNYYTSESVGIACGFLIAALHNTGLATLTHTPSPMRFLNSILGRPSDERPFLILVTGFPKSGAKVPAISKHPLEHIATFIGDPAK